MLRQPVRYVGSSAAKTNVLLSTVKFTWDDAGRMLGENRVGNFTHFSGGKKTKRLTFVTTKTGWLRRRSTGPMACVSLLTDTTPRGVWIANSRLMPVASPRPTASVVSISIPIPLQPPSRRVLKSSYMASGPPARCSLTIRRVTRREDFHRAIWTPTATTANLFETIHYVYRVEGDRVEVTHVPATAADPALPDHRAVLYFGDWKPADTANGARPPGGPAGRNL